MAGMAGVGGVWEHRGVLGLLVRRDLTVKYQNSVLGYVWSLIEPLTIAATYWFVFGVLYHQQVSDGVPYVLFLASGIFAWIWVSAVLGEATTALTAQRGLITTIRVPREVFPIGRVLGKFVEYLAALPVLVVVALLGGAPMGARLFYLPVAVAVQAIFLVGVALLLASVNVMLRDTERFVRLLQRLLFYALPIIYPLSQLTSADLPTWVKVVYQLNPLVGIIELHHAAWTYAAPAPLAVWAAVLGSLLTLVVGLAVFRRLEPAVLKEL